MRGIGEFRRGPRPPDNLERRRIGVSGDGETGNTHIHEVHDLDVVGLGDGLQLRDDRDERFISPIRQPIRHPATPSIAVSGKRPRRLAEGYGARVTITHGGPEYSIAVAVVERDANDENFPVGDGIATTVSLRAVLEKIFAVAAQGQVLIHGQTAGASTFIIAAYRQRDKRVLANGGNTGSAAVAVLAIGAVSIPKTRAK